MLRVTVSKSRKLSKDYNSTGFSVTIDGEISAPLDSPRLILDQIQILHDLADESLQVQCDQFVQGNSPTIERNENQGTAKEHYVTIKRQANRPARWQPRNENQATDVAATNKQVQYLLNLGKQKGLSKVDLEEQVSKQLNFNSVKSVHQLSKSEATSAIDFVKA